MIDTNILIRAVLGSRVRAILSEFAEQVSFRAPIDVVQEAEEHLTLLTLRREGDPENAHRLLSAIAQMLDLVGPEIYAAFETEARRRLAARDPDDWPILATALATNSPVWTEDNDFFGCGVATWTTDRIRIFLDGSIEE